MSPTNDPHSLFHMDLYFLQAALNGIDPSVNALLAMCVLRLGKERGIVGKIAGDYLLDLNEEEKEEKKDEGRKIQRVMRMEQALEWSQCGSDEIRIQLMELVTNSLYVG